jgi:DSBA-like thioredoxin domain
VKTVEFYYDLVSPYSYLAHREVSRICDEHGAGLSLRPMLLGVVHKAVGLQAPIETEAKARYQAEDIRRWAEHYGLPMEFPKPFPFRTLKTMRAAVFLKDRGELEAPARPSPCTGRKAARRRGSGRRTRTDPSPRRRAGSGPIPTRSSREPPPPRPRRRSRGRRARRLGGESSGRRRSSWGTRCSGATTDSTL